MIDTGTTALRGKQDQKGLANMQGHIKCQNTLIVTGQDSIPIQTQDGIEILQRDMETTHEEADVLLYQCIFI